MSMVVGNFGQLAAGLNYVWDANLLDWVVMTQPGGGSGGTVAQGAAGSSPWLITGAVTLDTSLLATSAKQDTGNTSLASVDSKTPALGQALAAGSSPVVLTAAQVSVLTPPANTGYALDATLATIDADLKANIVLAAGTHVIGHVITDTGSVVAATLGAETTKVIGTVNVASGQSISANAGTNLNTSLLALDATVNALLKPANTLAAVTTVGTITNAVTVTPPTLTKATQGSTGFSTQDLKDAGRTAKSFYANNVASGTTGTETLIALTQSSGTGAAASASSYTITSGKTLRLTALSVASRGNATATAQSTVFNLRLNTAGAVVVTSTPIVFAAQSATAAVASAWDRVILPIPDGYEIAGNGTIAIGISAAATFTTNAPTWSVNLIGYEY